MYGWILGACGSAQRECHQTLVSMTIRTDQNSTMKTRNEGLGELTSNQTSTRTDARASNGKSATSGRGSRGVRVAVAPGLHKLQTRDARCGSDSTGTPTLASAASTWARSKVQK